MCCFTLIQSSQACTCLAEGGLNLLLDTWHFSPCTFVAAFTFSLLLVIFLISFTFITKENRPRSRYTLSLKKCHEKQSQQLNKAQKDNNTVVVNRVFLILPTDSCSCPERRRNMEQCFFSIWLLFIFLIYIEISRPNVDIWKFWNARKQSVCGFVSKWIFQLFAQGFS